jgi:putative ABC transport system permease protein
MDLRFAWRSLRRSPGFSSLVMLTLALGIGATTTMFSVVWAVFLKPLPWPGQERLVTIWESDPRSGTGKRRVSPANFVDWMREARSFEAVGVLPNWTGEAWTFNVAGRDRMERVDGIYASSGFFTVMGVRPLVGRTFGVEEDTTRGRRTVVLSHAYWQTRFGGDPAIVGRTLDIDTFRGGAFTIIGVMPAGFEFPRDARIWLSLGDWGGGPMPAPDASSRCCPWYTVVARLKPGATIATAGAELTAIAGRVSARHPEGAPAAAAGVESLRDTLVGDQRLPLFALFGAVGCILLIGCANVANLLLSRAVGRHREVLTRVALGATRWGIARQLLCESLLLAVPGAVLGVAASMWGQGLIATAMRERVTLIERTQLDWAVLGFAIVLTLATTAVCGLAPLVDWRSVGWSTRSQTESRASRRTRQALVVGEVALAVGLVAIAGLFLRTVGKLRGVDVGFDTGQTLVVSTDLTTSRLRERGSAARFIAAATPRLSALPGVRVVGAATGVPLEGGPATQAITRQDRPALDAASSPQVVQTAVTRDYFRAMNMTLLRGRLFTDDDRADGLLVAIVNDTAARRYWPGEDPIGKRFAVGSRERFGSFRAVQPGEIEWREIVGVVSDVRSAGFASEVQPEVYHHYTQYPLYDPSLIVRATEDPTALVAAIRREIEAVNPNVVITRVRSLEAIADQSIEDPRLRATIAVLFSGLALLLGMLGVYGVTSHMVAQQTREIGVRIALGAEPASIARMVVVRALRPVALGVVLGLGVAWAAGRLVASLLFGVTPADGLTLLVTCLLLIGAGLVASVWPTRLALRIQPIAALRDE